MTIFQSIVLGIVQGLTEFLPISSSGHLVIVPFLLGWKFPATEAFIFDVLVQIATLVGVFAYFWNDLVAIVKAVIKGLVQRRPFEDPMARLGWLVVLATIPAGVVGLLFKDTIEAAFQSVAATALFLLITAIFLFIGERFGKRVRKIESLTWIDALVIGVFQAVSVLPGVSRSGSTITGGMLRDVERPAAARFSFLMSIPIMLAAGLLATRDMVKTYPAGTISSLLPVFIPGFIAAAVVGYLAIRWLLRYLSHRSLYVFSAYCAVVGLIVLAIYYL